VQPGPQDLLALDFEQNGDDTMTLAQAEQFVTEVFNQTGRHPGFYSDSLAGSLLGGSVNETLRQCWLWRAEYGAVCTVPPTWPTWTMWQYTDGEHGEGLYPIAGIGGRGTCDRSKFNGDIDALARLWGYAESAPASAPEVGPPLNLASFMKSPDDPQTG
jgi:lysozyme